MVDKRKIIRTTEGRSGIANPASVFGVSKGGKLEIVTDPVTGDQRGYLTFPSGQRVEEWTYYRQFEHPTTPMPKDTIKVVRKQPTPSNSESRQFQAMQRNLFKPPFEERRTTRGVRRTTSSATKARRGGIPSLMDWWR